ncbi:MAG: hypothetical protein WCS70_10575 [Verrucomicrobiota bacterium]
MTAPKKITVTIDGKVCEGAPGQTIVRVDTQKKFETHEEKYIHSGACFEVCGFDAVKKTSLGRQRAELALDGGTH